MIYYPTIEQNIIDISGVQVTGEVDYNTAIQDISTNKYVIDSISIQSESVEQLQQLIFYKQLDLAGGSTLVSKKPMMDSYQKQSVLKDLKVYNWNIDGKSNIEYILLPSQTIRFVITFNTAYSRENQFKKETKAKSTFELLVEELDIPDQCREPEEEKIKPVTVALIEVSRIKSKEIELGVKEYKQDEYELRQKILDKQDTEPDEKLCIEKIPTIEEMMLAKANGIELKIPNCNKPPDQIVEKSRGIFSKETVPFEEEKTIPQLMAEMMRMPTRVVEGFKKNNDEYINNQYINEKSKGIFAKKTDFIKNNIPTTELLINKDKAMATTEKTVKKDTCDCSIELKKPNETTFYRWILILGSVSVGLAILNMFKTKAA
jgi:hypothetical protein